MQCERCRKVVPDNKIQMLPKQTVEAVCHICRGDVPKVFNLDRMDEEVKVTFFCHKCNYKFKYNLRGTVRLYCPWCGKAENVAQLE